MRDCGLDKRTSRRLFAGGWGVEGRLGIARRLMGAVGSIIIGPQMPKKTTIYSVSQVNSLIKTALEENLPSRLAVAGEIPDWVVAGSGHAYFSLKDENALLPCVMWRSSLNKVKFDAENG